MAICAYCSLDRPMTREHVIPSFMYEFQKTYSPFIGWSEPANKVLESEQTIRDVCADCNNRKLGALDGYAKQMLESGGLFVQDYAKRTITLNIDYQKFVRWMLKVSYNSARCQANPSPVFSTLVPFILDGISPPAKTEIAVFAQLLGKHKLTEEQGFINPFVVRLCKLQFPESPGFEVRLNIFGPLTIYILFFEPEISVGHVAVAKRRFMKLVHNIVEVTPATKILHVTQSRITWYEMWETQLRRQRGW